LFVDRQGVSSKPRRRCVVAGWRHVAHRRRVTSTEGALR
jgi:hypothetical protein